MAGTMGQVVLGGITVLLDLNPVAVSGHFLVSMALLFVAHLLWRRADPVGPATAADHPDETTRWLLRAQLPLAVPRVVHRHHRHRLGPQQRRRSEPIGSASN